jgi:hypothetical protein
VLLSSSDLVDCDCQDDDQSTHDVLPKRIYSQDIEAVANRRDQKRSNEGSDNVTLPSEEAGSSDDYRSDGEEFVTPCTMPCCTAICCIPALLGASGWSVRRRRSPLWSAMFRGDGDGRS